MEKRRGMDMLNGTLWNKILLFALPLAATSILQQLFNAADIAVVGQFSPTDREVAIAAVGANSSLIGLILNLFVGMALGANVVIARAVGMRDKKTITKAVSSSIIFALAGGVCVAVFCIIISQPLLTALSVPPDVLPLAVRYLRIYLCGLPVILLTNYESAFFRAIGDTRTPLIVLMVSGIINVVLNLVFVMGAGMSVEGVAIATVIANVIGSMVLLRKLVRTDSEIRVRLADFRFDGRVFLQILRIGLPSGIQMAVFSFANILIQSCINTLGTSVMTASGMAFNVEIMAYYVMNSFGQACTTFVGQNAGAGNFKRCRKILLISLGEVAIALACTVCLILFFGRPLLSLFNGNAELIDIGYVRLSIIMPSYALSMLYDNMGGYMRGFGISLTPALVTLLGVCGLRIIWVFAVFPAAPGFRLLLMVYPVSLGITAALMFVTLMIRRPAKRGIAAVGSVPRT